MFSVLFLVIGVIVLYKLIFGFIIPVYRASRDIRRQFRKMQGEGERDEHVSEPPKQERKVEKNYIDFEEIK